jgi:hypothetical protein
MVFEGAVAGLSLASKYTGRLCVITCKAKRAMSRVAGGNTTSWVALLILGLKGWLFC